MMSHPTWRAGFGLLVVGAGAAGQVGAAERPIVRAVRTNSPVKIDGRLDEPAWRRAEVIRLRRADGKADAQRKTELRVLWDADFLYIGFVCEDRDVWTAHRGRDSAMWTEDVVEAFIDVNGDEKTYVELEINPTNDLFDAFFLGRRGPHLLAWNPAIKHAVAVNGSVNVRGDRDREWSGELALPLPDLDVGRKIPLPRRPIHEGLRWRINFYRVNSSAGEIEFQAWAPTPSGDFHDTTIYGWLEFVNEPVRRDE